MELVVKVLSGETQSVNVDPSAIMGELRTRPSQLKLSINNGQTLQLDIDQKTVINYSLRSGSTVMLLITSLHVFVTNLTGKTKKYDITEDETVEQLMMKILQKEGIPEDQQRLIYNGRQLEAGRKLQDYNIISGSTIHMVLRLRG